jgi:hypothetical protein
MAKREGVEPSLPGFGVLASSGKTASRFFAIPVFRATGTVAFCHMLYFATLYQNQDSTARAFFSASVFYFLGSRASEDQEKKVPVYPPFCAEVLHDS